MKSIFLVLLLALGSVVLADELPAWTAGDPLSSAPPENTPAKEPERLDLSCVKRGLCSSSDRYGDIPAMQQSYNQALQDYQQTKPRREQAERVYNDSKTAYTGVVSQYQSAVTERDRLAGEVAKQQVKTDRNPTYVGLKASLDAASAEVTRTKGAVDQLTPRYEQSFASYNSAAQAERDALATMKKNSEATPKAVTEFYCLEGASCSKRTISNGTGDYVVENGHVWTKAGDVVTSASPDVQAAKKSNESTAATNRSFNAGYGNNLSGHQSIVSQRSAGERIATAGQAKVGQINQESQRDRAQFGYLGGPGGANYNPNTAKRDLDKILSRDPGNAAALSARALANAKLGDRSAACADATAALAANAADQQADSISKLNCPSGDKQLLAFQTQLKGGTANPPDPSGGRAGAGSTAPAAKSAEAAEGDEAESLSGAVPIFADKAAAQAQTAGELLADALKMFKTGNHKDALEAIQKALALDPDNAQAYQLMAGIYKDMGDYDSMLKALDAALALDPNNEDLLNQKIYALNKLERYEEALSASNALIAANPTGATAYVNKAYALRGLGDKEGMLAALRQAAALDPHYDVLLQRALKAMAAGNDLFDFLAEEKKAKPAPAAAPSVKAVVMKRALIALGGLAFVGLLFSLMPLFSRRVALRGEAGVSSNGLLAGKYELKGKLGQGGMGVVYEGFDHNLKRRVAVKKMKSELQSDAAVAERFVNEARTVARMTHPGIVAIHDVLSVEGDIYMVLDFVEGVPLSALIKERQRLPLPECQKLFEGIAQAMDCAHKNKILHCDLKPANIMVEKDGTPRVMDFGVAREAKDSISKLTNLDRSGTLAYMAPEQHLGRAVRASDVYALGVCLYESLTGEHPFKGADLLAQKERKAYEPAASKVPGLPKGVDVLLAAALEPDPRKRIADALEFEQSLRMV